MLEGKGDYAQMLDQGFQTGFYSTEAPAASLKPSNQSQTLVDYVDPFEESAWSRNLDSAASMFSPSLGIWNENFQDLSTWCHNPKQNTRSAMEHVTNVSRCIVQDDELNTPEVGIQSEFHFTKEALPKDDTCPCELEGWDIPPAIELPLESSSEKRINSVTSVHCESSISEERLQSAKEIDNKSKCEVVSAYYIDESWGLSLSHEEQVVSSPSLDENYEMTRDNSPVSVTSISETDEGAIGNHRNLESLLQGETAAVTDTKQQHDDNLSLKNLLADSIYKVDKDTSNEIYPTNKSYNDIIIEAVSNSNINPDKEIVAVASMVLPTSQVVHPMETGFNFGIQTREMIVPEKSASLNMDSSFSNKTRTFDTNMQVEVEEAAIVVNLVPSRTMNPVNSAAKKTLDLNPDTPVANANFEETVDVSEAMKKPSEVGKGPAPKKKLVLNLASLLGTDDISTPVLEPLIKGDGSFDLLNFIVDNNEPFPFDSPDTKQDNPLVAACSSSGPSGMQQEQITTEVVTVEQIKNEDVSQENYTENTTIDLTEMRSLIKPLVIGKSVDGNWTIAPIEEEIVIDQLDEQTKRKPPPRLKTNRNRRTSKRNLSDSEDEVPQPKRPRGRPAKQPLPSTSRDETTHLRNRARPQRTRLSTSSEEVFSPVKRERHSSVESVCDRYRELRDRNNEASRKSRQNRKSREHEMRDLAATLEKENRSLKIKADEMERLVKMLREGLLEAVMKNKK